MKKVICVLMAVISVLSAGKNVTISRGEIQQIDQQNNLRQKLYAKSAVLMDADSGRILFGKDGEVPRPMASTTKILTCILALEYGNPDMVIAASSHASSQPKVHLGVRTGEQYYLKDLLFSLMLESHNDAAVMIAEGIGGSVEGFAEMMNQKARDIGCENSYFITPNGLDAEVTDKTGKKQIHETTAADLAKIMRYCIRISPQRKEFLKIVQTQNYHVADCEGKNGRDCQNHNALLNMMSGAFAGKTGFTGDAGYCYVGAAERDGETLIAVVLACGWPNHRTWKWQDVQRMMEYGWENYEFCGFDDIEIDEEKIQPIPVRDGEPRRLGESVYVSIAVDGQVNGNQKPGGEKLNPLNPLNQGDEGPRERTGEGLLLREDEKIYIKYHIPVTIQAPVHKGELVGSIQYCVGEKIMKVVPVRTLNEIPTISLRWAFRISCKLFLV